VLSPKAAFLQVKVLLRTPTGQTSPVFNRSASSTSSRTSPVGLPVRVPAAERGLSQVPEQDDVILGLERRVRRRAGEEGRSADRHGRPEVRAQGFQTIVWDASDENGDTLSYALSAKKDGGDAWRVLEADWAETIYAFDTLSFPDGTYLIRLTASDARSNPPGLELKTERTSPALVIDNSLPVVKNFTAVKSGTGSRSPSRPRTPTLTSRKPRSSSGRGNGRSSSPSTASPIRGARPSRSR